MGEKSPSLFRDVEIYREYRKQAKEAIAQYFVISPRLLLLSAAENGDTEAMFILGSLYENGCWNPNDDYNKALAVNKNIKEMTVSVDYNEALRWYDKAAMLGEHNAEVAVKRLRQKMEQQCSPVTENNRTIGQESVKKEVKPQSPALAELNRMIGLKSVKE